MQGKVPSDSSMQFVRFAADSWNTDESDDAKSTCRAKKEN